MGGDVLARTWRFSCWPLADVGGACTSLFATGDHE